MLYIYIYIYIYLFIYLFYGLAQYDLHVFFRLLVVAE